MKSQRAVLLINKPFQLSVIAWFAFVSVLVSVTYFLSMMIFFQDLSNDAVQSGLTREHVFFKYLEMQQKQMFMIFGISTAISVFLIFAGGIWLSHRVAGPLYRLTAHLNKSSKDSVTPLKFRKGDYFPEVQDAFNDFIARKEK